MKRTTRLKVRLLLSRITIDNDQELTLVSKIRTIKAKADPLLKEGNLQEALKTYYEAYLLLRGLLPAFKDQMAASLLASRNPIDESSKLELVSLRRGVYGNMCLIFLKQEKFDRVVKFCEEIVMDNDAKPQVIPENVKSFYRLAISTLKQGDTDKARYWADKVLTLEPNNTDVRLGQEGQSFAWRDQIKGERIKPKAKRTDE